MLTFVYACMVFTWACIISYYDLISRCILPRIREYKHFYRHMFQISCVLYPAYAKKKKKKTRQLFLLHIQEDYSLTFAKLPFAFNSYLSLTHFLKPSPTLSHKINLSEEGVRGSSAGLSDLMETFGPHTIVKTDV